MTDSEKKYRELLDMYYKDREEYEKEETAQNRRNDGMEKMIHSHEVLWLSDKGNVAVAYAREDLGEKYKIYCKAKYGDNSVWEYYNGFGTQGEAMRYASQIYDVEIERQNVIKEGVQNVNFIVGRMENLHEKIHNRCRRNI